jgi:putative redox protein
MGCGAAALAGAVRPDYTVLSTVSLKWAGSELMIGADSYGHPIVTGSWPEQSPEWAGLKPSDLLLLSAAACSAYDVVKILLKQREPLAGLEVQCAGEQAPEPPYVFTSIHLHYRASGAVNPRNLARAIELSETKYCSVINTLKASVAITSDYEIAAG